MATEKPIRIEGECEVCGADDLQWWPSDPIWAECGECGAEYDRDARGAVTLDATTKYSAPARSDYSERMSERSQMGLCDY